MDIRNAAVGVFYGRMGDPESHLGGTVPDHYAKFENWLTQQGTLYTAGATPTAGDFHLWEMLDQFTEMAKDSDVPSPLEKFPKLKAMHAALRADPKLAKYFAGDLYKL